VTAHAPAAGKVADFCRDKRLAFVECYDDILRNPAIDAVVIATPHSFHFEQVCRAARAGKHVFTEKPLALDYQSACEAVAAVERQGVRLAVGFVRRFHPSICEVRARLADGRLGTICGFVGQQTSGTGPYLAPGSWRLDPVESPAAAMTANGVHLLDHMIEFGGPIAGVQCVTGRRGLAHADDTTSVLLTFRNGPTGLLFCTISSGPNYNFSVYGSRGHAEVSDTTLDVFRFTPLPDRAPDGPVKQPESEILRNSGLSMVRAQMLEFARCIKETRPFAVPVADVLHGVAVLDAIARSAATGNFVEVRP
jgi:predicted dehydrogenase